MADGLLQAGIRDQRLVRSYTACRLLHATHDHSSYSGLTLFPAWKRPYLSAVAAMSIHLDRAADGQLLQHHPQHFETQAQHALTAVDTWDSNHGLFLALAHTFRTWNIDRRWLHRYVLGVRDDTHCRRLATMEDLTARCHGQVLPEFMMTVPILEPLIDDPQLLLHGMTQAARGWQLVDVLTDLASDHAQDRCYIPAEELVRYGIDPDEFVEGVTSVQADTLIREYAQQGQELFGEVMSNIYWFHPSSRLGLMALCRMYQLQLNAIISDGSLCLLRGPKPSRLSRATVAVPALCQALMRLSHHPTHTRTGLRPSSVIPCERKCK